MAFGVKRKELASWKAKVSAGEIAFLTHYWYEPRFPQYDTITKVGCSDLTKLVAWCRQYDLEPRYIHHRETYPHFDLIGPKQKQILEREGQWDQIERFGLE
jgi:hypothetical protein